MMDRVTVALVVIVAGLFGIWGGSCVAKAAPPAPDPAQVRPDIFPWSGGNMQTLNPTTVKAKATRAIAYRVVVRPGCAAGRIPQDLEAMNAHTREAVGLNIVRNDAAYDFTVNISCGLEHINKCGSVNVFCLPDGFPGNTTVYLSDVLSGYEAGSRLGIPLHEIVGHAVGTWNEQYAVCGSSCGFASTPGLRDYMNTGPLSRHGFEASECGRWMRTMWEDAPCAVTHGYAPPPPTSYPFFDGTTWHMCDPSLPDEQCYWATYVVGDQWYDKFGRPEWAAPVPQPDGTVQQYNWRLQAWFWFGQSAYQLNGSSWDCVSFCP